MDDPSVDPRFRELTPELLATEQPSDIGGAVVQHLYWQQLMGIDEAQAIANLAPGYRAIYATWAVDAEVLNGGFNQFFYNPNGALAGQALLAYEMFGADDYAAVMRAAIATYESERDQLSRFHDQGTLEAFSESYKHTELGALDARYYALRDRIYDVWADIVRNRPELFRTTT